MSTVGFLRVETSRTCKCQSVNQLTKILFSHHHQSHIWPFELIVKLIFSLKKISEANIWKVPFWSKSENGRFSRFRQDQNFVRLGTRELKFYMHAIYHLDFLHIYFKLVACFSRGDLTLPISAKMALGVHAHEKIAIFEIFQIFS